MDYARMLHLDKLAKKSSLFLFGARATGKSTLIKKTFSDAALVINLLHSKNFLSLSQDPSELEQLIDASGKKLVVIDECQKIPELLDEVHRLIEAKKIKFILTGSSARKLKAGNANLLAGRAWVANMYPLVSAEIPDFDLDRFLQFGGLPAIYPSDDPAEHLYSYVNLYLKEEIQAEGLIRKIPQFARFLKTAALSSGELLNFEKIGRDSQNSASTVRDYYSILQDTLIGHFVEPWIESKKRKAISTAKFYLFDTGVLNTISEIESFSKNDPLWGNRFEHFIGHEIRAYLSYYRIKYSLCFWRSTSDFEVDFVFGKTAIEVKSTKHVQKDHLKGLMALHDEKYFKQFFLISNDINAKKVGEITCLHWKDFLTKLWSGKIAV